MVGELIRSATIPIEHERKFVLSPPFSILEKKVSKAADKVLFINQGYIYIDKKLSVRIRSINDSKYQMTVKRTVKGQTIEIETDICFSDFSSLWGVAIVKLEKIRYLIDDWEIDFFKNNNENYFAQAEIELPPDVDYPDKILKIIEKDILYSVKKGDNRFSNKKIGNVNYSNKILKLLLEKK